MEMREESSSVAGQQIAIIIISGDISDDPGDEMRRVIARRLASGYCKFVIDICDVRPIVTKTISALLPALMDVRRVGGTYWFVSTSRSFDGVLERTRLTSQFLHSQTTQEAIQHLAGTAQ